MAMRFTFRVGDSVVRDAAQSSLTATSTHRLYATGGISAGYRMRWALEQAERLSNCGH